ncbi:hypothetical protein WKT22_00931 [Candidatus Lokiarchaeum ossiferum]
MTRLDVDRMFTEEKVALREVGSSKSSKGDPTIPNLSFISSSNVYEGTKFKMLLVSNERIQKEMTLKYNIFP